MKILRKLRIDEISAVDRPAQAPARAAIMKREDTDVAFDVEKRAVMTSEANGHAHTLQLDYGNGEQLSGTTSYASAPGEQSHSHPWIMNQGDVVIGMANGHNHEPEVISKAAFSSKERAALASSGAAMPDGSFPIRNGSDLRNAIHAWGRANPGDRQAVARHIKSRAKALGMTDILPQQGALADALKKGLDSADQQNPQAASAAAGDEMTSEEMQAAIAKAVKDAKDPLEAQLRKAQVMAELTDAQKAHLTKQSPEGQDAFLKLTPDARQAELVKASEANAVVYKSLDGEEFRKSDDPRLIRMAKSADEDRKARISAETISKRERLAKAASELTKLPGAEDVKVSLLEAIDGLPVEKRDAIMAMLKAHDAGLSQAFKNLGAEGTPEASGPEAALEKLAKSIAAKDPNLTEQQAFVKALESVEGAKLYEQHLEIQRAKA